MNTITKYISTTIIASSLVFTACSNEDKDPVYGSDTNIEASATVHPYEDCLNLIFPKAYNDADGLNIEPSSVISMITPTSSTPYWDAVKKGAFQAIEELNTNLGYSGKDRVTLSFNTASNVDDQINILDSELSRYPSAIAIVPLDSTAFGMQFDQAMENGIPIITFETSTTNNVSATVATDHLSATEELVSNFQELSESPDTYFIITSDLSDEVYQSRTYTVTPSSDDESDESNTQFIIDLSDLEAIHHQMYLQEQSSSIEEEEDDTTADHIEIPESDENDIDDTESDANDDTPIEEPIIYDYSLAETITYLLENYPEYANILVLDGKACELLLDTFDSIDFNYNNYNILSFDTSEKLLVALAENKIDGLQITNPYGIGYASIIASIRASLDMGNEAFINTGHIFINSDNINDEVNTDFFY